VLDCWVAYREFWFDADQSALYNGDSAKVDEIATYLRANPSLQIGLDNASVARSGDRRVKDLHDARLNAVRSALVNDGIAANRITTGALGDASQSRDGRVAVLIRTNPSDPQIVVPVNRAVVADRWTVDQEFWFDQNGTDLHAADATKIAEIATRMRQDSSLRVGIDSNTDRVTNGAQSASLASRRGDSVRDALIAAGVPSDHITRGSVGDPGRQRDRCVAVLVRTVQLAQAP